MDSICNDQIASPPDEAFAQFCKSRLEGLSLTQNEPALLLYREAAERGQASIQKSLPGSSS